MRIGFPLQMIRTSCLLYTFTPSLVKIEILPLSAVLPTLINECRNSVNVLAFFADVDIVRNRICVTNFSLPVSQLATFTFLLYLCRIGKCACLQSSLVM